MSRIVVMMSISLDGYMEGPDRRLDWQSIDEPLHQHFNDVLRPMGAFVSGRVTHELMASFWPTADQDSSNGPVMAEYAAIWRDKPKYVVSTTLESADWNTSVLRTVNADQMRSIAAASGGDVAVGGAELARSLAEQRLVDEYRLYVHPVILGDGKPLFARSATATTQLKLVESSQFDNGVALLRYSTSPAA